MIPMVLIFGVVSTAQSQGTLSWQFDSTAFVVQPSDQILLTGTVSNPTDTPFIISSGASAFWTGDLSSAYNFTWSLQITGQSVPANGTLQFDFGTLTPIGDYAQPGVYQPGGVSQPSPAGIYFSAGALDYTYSANTFVVTVVPEPRTMALLTASIGLAGVLLKRRQSRIDATTRAR